ncbi:FAD-dependent monooxygenase [Flexibacterium corallicola]|uniref:FAD-dependent monooxygenase n=1 Tax=Flexibacterium corallicola TaxID=3037259 RepID=UPI00286F8004|nr:FAD-dependent monooxygenase [Pseudovibrio sp. M1P-2-3]
MQKKIAIAGAGVAGMTCALFLAQQGYEIDIFEAAPELSEVGAGLQLSANACHCLAELGLLSKLQAVATMPSAINISSGKNGKLIAKVPLGQAAEDKYGAPYLVIHRADLQSILKDAVLASPTIQLHLGYKLDTADIAPEGLHLKFKNQGSQTQAYALLVGADGVWSKTRTNILGLPPASTTGRVAYRATVPSRDIPEELMQTTGLWMAERSHLVHYPVKSAREFNLVCVTLEDWTSENWSHPATPEDVEKHFCRWHPTPRKIIGKATSWTRWALCGTDPTLPWVKGPVALVGDAAHAMLPFMAQGAGMAIEDVAILSKVIEKYGALPKSLAKYEQLRRSRVEKVVTQAQNNGRVYHMGFPTDIARNLIMRHTTPEKLLGRFDWVYEWKPDSIAV